MNSKTKHTRWASLIFAALLIASPRASADAVCDWNIKVGDIVVSAKMGPPPANRAMAIANTAVYEAVNAITKRYPAGALKLDAAPGASVDAAIAAANRRALAKLLPSQQAAIDSAYQAALAKIADGASKTSGIAVGEQAAAAILAMRAEERCCMKLRPQTRRCDVPRDTAVTHGRTKHADDHFLAFRPGRRLHYEPFVARDSRIEGARGKSTRDGPRANANRRFWKQRCSDL